MNAIEFMQSLTGKVSVETRKISAKEYFESEQGKKMLEFIKVNVRVVDDMCFTADDLGVEKIHKNPLYKGRHFFTDMSELGFIRTIISYHQDEAPIKTYEFKI